MEKNYVIVVYNKNHERVHESNSFKSYPPESSIVFGLNFPDVSYALVEERYGKGEVHEPVNA